MTHAQTTTTPVPTLKGTTPVTTAQAAPKLYGPNGQALVATPEPTAGDWQPVRTTDNATVWERPREQAPAADVLAAAETEARQIVADARAEARRVADEARSLRARTLGAADSEARTIRERAAAETAKREKRGQTLDVWMARAAIAGTVGLTASGEYMLARMAQFPPEVAWLLPFVIDVYVIQAFRRHRDIAQAICLTVAANVIYHLAAAGMFGVITDSEGKHQPTWWLIALVASIASIILWRMHVMTAPAKEKKPKQQDRDTDSRPVDGGSQMAAEPTASVPPAAVPTEPVRGSDTAPVVAAEVPAIDSQVGSPRLASVPAIPVSGSADPVAVAEERVSGRDQRRSRRGSTARGGDSGSDGSAGSDRQVAALVALMKRRGSADAVTLADAKKACPGVAERTAARRLQTARSKYDESVKRAVSTATN
jgi:hypothetical protein